LPNMPVITAGRIQSPETAEGILRDKKADMIGLARVLLADPLWPKKAQGLLEEPIISCESSCSLCMKRVISGKPALCSQWERSRQKEFLKKIGEKKEEGKGAD
jgi:2,4-dienoyl-CoA reductase-like NADH-dependent reductase (Old Yellow Enzyme family)